MILSRLEQQIMRDEGYRSVAYQDTVGVWTLGFGSTRMFGAPIRPHDVCTKEKARAQLRADLYAAAVDCEKLFDSWTALDSVRQEVLVNMRYNLGLVGLTAFKKMRRAISLFEWEQATEEMKDSKWYSQVGGRGQRLAAAMATGQWTEETA